MVDADTGEIVFGSNIDQPWDPASISKMMTAYMAFEGENKSIDVTYKQVAVISGEITAQGIKNFRYAFCLLEKNDPFDKVMPVGGTRIWFDSDNMSERE